MIGDEDDNGRDLMQRRVYKLTGGVGVIEVDIKIPAGEMLLSGLLYAGTRADWIAI